MPKSHTYYTI